MATLRIALGVGCAVQPGGQSIQAMQMPPIATEALSFDASTRATDFAAGANLVRLEADAEVYLEFGPSGSPTATASSVIRLDANTPEYFGVTPGQTVAAYDGTS